MVTRTVSNSGTPIVDGTGAGRGDVVGIITLINETTMAPTADFDLTTGELILPVRIPFSTKANTTLGLSSGELKIALWPPDRGAKGLKYLVEIMTPIQEQYVASLPSGDGDYPWFYFINGTAYQLPDEAPLSDGGTVITGDSGETILSDGGTL